MRRAQIVVIGRGVVSLLCCGWLLVAGCQRTQLPPQEQAHEHFAHGAFDAAIQSADEGLQGTSDSVLAADLWALKGRCYFEQSARAGQSQAKDALLQQALTCLGKSIETLDNAEARHLRAMIHDQMQLTELADADKSVARELDESYRSAYLTERPETILLEDDPNDSVVDEGSASKSNHDVRPQENPDTDSDPVFPRRGDSDADDEQLEPTTGASGNRTLPSAEDTPGEPRRTTSRGEPDETPNSSDQEPSKDEPTPDEPEPPRARPLPSGIQPFAVPPTWNGPTAMPSAPTTGIVGPPGGTGVPTGVPAQMPLLGTPSTGITGLRDVTGRFVAPTAPPNVPTTGVTGVPLNPTLPSGIPGQFLPQGSFSRQGPLPFTGALPTQFQPVQPVQPGPWSVSGPGFGGNLPMTGPAYSPLRPSPLIQPGTTVGPRLAPTAPPTARATETPEAKDQKPTETKQP